MAEQTENVQNTEEPKAPETAAGIEKSYMER